MTQNEIMVLAWPAIAVVAMALFGWWLMGWINRKHPRGVVVKTETSQARQPREGVVATRGFAMEGVFAESVTGLGLGLGTLIAASRAGSEAYFVDLNASAHTGAGSVDQPESPAPLPNARNVQVTYGKLGP